MRGPLLSGVLISTATLVASCRPAGILDPQGPIAAAERLLLINSTAIMLVVVIPVILAILAFAWWYRASNARASRSPDSSYEGRLEFVVWSIPALTVILLSGVIWISSHQLDPRAPIPAKADPLRVDVVALDWKWLFIYPRPGHRGRQSAGHPGRNTGSISAHLGDRDEFLLRAAARQPDLHDERHDHAPPPARGCAGPIPRVLGQFQRRRLSRHALCRQGGAAGDFDAWVAQARGTGSALDEAGYAELAKPSTAVPATIYRSVAPRLFERIIDQTLSGPNRAGVGAASHPPDMATGS